MIFYKQQSVISLKLVLVLNRSREVKTSLVTIRVRVSVRAPKYGQSDTPFDDPQTQTVDERE